MRLRFSRREVRDLLVAWLALGVAFTVFLERGLTRAIVEAPASIDLEVLAIALAISLLTAGLGFLLHELAHKVVAVRFGQIAGFRADYSMLLLTIFGALVGFLFAAPGAVYHRGSLTKRQGGLIALAGPVTNMILAGGFFLLLFGFDPSATLVGVIAVRGVVINLLLAGFNMIPFGPLDGRTVLDWSTPVFAITFLVTAVPAAAMLFGVVP